MKSRYTSYPNANQSPIQRITHNPHRPTRYAPRSPPIIEIYDLEVLELDSHSPTSSNSSSSSSSSLSPCSSNENFKSLYTDSNNSNSIYSINHSDLFLNKSHNNTKSTNNYTRQYSNNKNNIEEVAFTFPEFISSIINSTDINWLMLIIQDVARLLEHKFKDFKKLRKEVFI